MAQARRRGDGGCRRPAGQRRAKRTRRGRRVRQQRADHHRLPVHHQRCPVAHRLRRHAGRMAVRGRWRQRTQAVVRTDRRQPARLAFHQQHPGGDGDDPGGDRGRQSQRPCALAPADPAFLRHHHGRPGDPGRHLDQHPGRRRRPHPTGLAPFTYVRDQPARHC